MAECDYWSVEFLCFAFVLSLLVLCYAAAR